MPRLNDTLTTPPGGWRYTQAETECVMVGDHFEGLALKMVQHRSYKQLPRATMEEAEQDIHDQLCMVLEPRFCRAAPGEEYVNIEDLSNSLTMAKIIAFSASFVSFLKGGGKLVSPEVAEARAKICRGCPLNRPATSCSCAPFYKILNALIPSNRKIEGLHICGACGCALTAKVLMPDATIRASNAGRDLTFPTFCWQRET